LGLPAKSLYHIDLLALTGSKIFTISYPGRPIV
jgi:hypothetical protein